MAAITCMEQTYIIIEFLNMIHECIKITVTTNAVHICSRGSGFTANRFPGNPGQNQSDSQDTKYLS